MEELFKIISTKLSNYHIFTNIFPGVLLCIVLQHITQYSVIPDNFFQACIIFYFAGIVNCRIGSLIIEPFLKKIKWITFAPYKDYITAEKRDEKIAILSQENNVYRSYITVFIISLTILTYKKLSINLPFLWVHKDWIFLVISLILFLCAYKKQTKYIKDRIEANINTNNNTQQ